MSTVTQPEQVFATIKGRITNAQLAEVCQRVCEKRGLPQGCLQLKRAYDPQTRWYVVDVVRETSPDVPLVRSLDDYCWVTSDDEPMDRGLPDYAIYLLVVDPVAELIFELARAVIQ